MIRIYLVLVILVIVFYLLRKFIKTSPDVISRIVKKTSFILVIAALIFLAVTGKLNWLFALFGLIVAFFVRILPVAIRYFPQLHQLWASFRNQKKQTSGQSNRAGASGKMTKEEAYEILGLNSSASQQDIILAHRKLIQKIHPDRGGSDYLAAKINQAKKILIKK